MGGTRYFLQGIKLLNTPGIRPFVIIPVLINLLLFAGLTTLLYQRFDAAMDWLVGFAGDWISWLLWLIWLIAGLIWLLLYGYFFAILSHLIASPFYGLLAERVELHLTGRSHEQPFTFAGLLVIARRSIVREFHKLAYLLPRFIGVAILCLLLSFIPVVGLLAPVLYFLWGAWSLALENTDFAADNNGIPFPALRDRCRRRRVNVLGFGAVAMVTASLPLINLFAIPAAVAGGTALWLAHLDEDPQPVAP